MAHRQPRLKPINKEEKKKMPTFTSKNGKDTHALDKPIKGCKASEVLLDVIGTGKMPEGLTLQFAKSYNAHFVNRKGKNALGCYDTKGVLVINGIAAELSDMGWKKQITKPMKSKKFFAINVREMDKATLKKLKGDIARVLGMKAVSAKKKKKKEKATSAEEATAGATA